MNRKQQQEANLYAISAMFQEALSKESIIDKINSDELTITYGKEMTNGELVVIFTNHLVRLLSTLEDNNGSDDMLSYITEYIRLTVNSTRRRVFLEQYINKRSN